jgi:hypothetical protein
LHHLKWEILFAEVQIGGNLAEHERQNNQDEPLPDRPPKNLMPQLRLAFEMAFEL